MEAPQEDRRSSLEAPQEDRKGGSLMLADTTDISRAKRELNNQPSKNPEVDGGCVHDIQ